MSNVEVMYSAYFKKDWAKRFHPSIFCGSLFLPAAKVAGLIIKKTVPFWPSFMQGVRIQLPGASVLTPDI